jgi:hypothetical protein
MHCLSNACFHLTIMGSIPSRRHSSDRASESNWRRSRMEIAIRRLRQLSPDLA